jgi:hypothetical protein
LAPTDSADSKGASATATLNVLPAAATATATYLRRDATTRGPGWGPTAATATTSSTAPPACRATPA